MAWDRLSNAAQEVIDSHQRPRVPMSVDAKCSQCGEIVGSISLAEGASLQEVSFKCRCGQITGMSTLKDWDRS